MLKMSRLRLTLLIVAVVAISLAVVLWSLDGAWHYGAMPTKGVIRTALFGGAGGACLCLAGWLEGKK